MNIICRGFTVFSIEVMDTSGKPPPLSSLLNPNVYDTALLLIAYDEEEQKVCVCSTEGFDHLLRLFFKVAEEKYKASNG